MLVRLPAANFFPNHVLQDVVLRTRSHILQIVLDPDMFIAYVWPWSRWDVEDQVFFVSDNPNLDYAAAKISDVFSFGLYGPDDLDPDAKINFDFMLYSLGWAKNTSSEPFYTIVPWKPSDSTLKDSNDKLDQYDYIASVVEEDLGAYQIPKSSSATAEYVIHGSTYRVTVHRISNLIKEQTKCHVPFWSLKMLYKVEKKDFKTIKLFSFDYD